MTRARAPQNARPVLEQRTPESRPLDSASRAILDLLTAGFSKSRLIEHEIGGEDGSPSVSVERLGQHRYLLTRYIELDGIRTEDPEQNDRVPAGRLEFVHFEGDWFPLERGLASSQDDIRDRAAALLRVVAEEQALRVAAAQALERPIRHGTRLMQLGAALWDRLLAAARRTNA